MPSPVNRRDFLSLLVEGAAMSVLQPAVSQARRQSTGRRKMNVLFIAVDDLRPQSACSMMPLLDDPKRPWKKAAFSQYPRGKVTGYSLRTDHFRYTEWQDRNTNKVMARDLYDHEKDPHENTNTAADPEYKQVVERLSQMLKRGWRAALPD